MKLYDRQVDILNLQIILFIIINMGSVLVFWLSCDNEAWVKLNQEVSV